MAVNQVLVVRVRQLMTGTSGLTERKMFGGICFSINGYMTCGVQQDDLVVRVGPDEHEKALLSAHARPMDFTGRPMKGYVYVAPEGTRRRADLARWIKKGTAFVNTLPPKKPKKRPPTKTTL